jgi:hypothetical protein
MQLKRYKFEPDKGVVVAICLGTTKLSAGHALSEAPIALIVPVSERPFADRYRIPVGD